MRTSDAMASHVLHSRPVKRVCDDLEKPLLDDRSYRVIKLGNDLEALLIHDPKEDKAAAAMDVNVGNFSDPEDMPGMAHAVEHLLFMGTEKYPIENDYSAYLARNGGYSNAFTASTSTNYYFEVSARFNRSDTTVSKETSPLFGALDRFAQFFVHPLFLEDTLDRELRAVDSENKKNLQHDMWRLHQLHKSSSSTMHPFHKFSTGNYSVLRDEPMARGVKIRDEFINFYKAQYSANRMKLTVLGVEPLDDLEAWVQELFSDVPDQQLPRLKWDDIPIYDPKYLSTQTFAKPVTDQRTLSLSFPYPDEEDLYRSQPSRYLSHLIGHEGPGSVLAYIKERGWANSLSAGSYPPCPGSALFEVDIRLTDKGLANYKEILKVVFQYISLLKQTRPQQWIVDEMKKLSEIGFRYKQKSPASSTVSSISGSMQKPVPRELLLSGSSIIRDFDPENITLGLDKLRPDNFHFTVVSQDETICNGWDQKEKWYGTEYKLESIPESLRKELEMAAATPIDDLLKELHLPIANAFVPQRLDVEKKEVKEPAVHPTLLRNDDLVRLWFKKDDQFFVPKANTYVVLRSPMASMTPLRHVLSVMYCSLVEDSLEEYSYDAELAGLGYSVGADDTGFDVSVHGYSDKMNVLLEKVLVSMRDLEIKQDRFDVIKERQIRDYKNAAYNTPFQQISGFSRLLMRTGLWFTEELLEEAKAVTMDNVREFFPQLLQQMHFEVLAHGNVYKEDALNVAKLVTSTLKCRPLPPQQWPSSRTVSLPEGADFVYRRTLEDPDNVNHCMDYYLMFGPNSNKPRRAALIVFDKITSEPCFDVLRTKEQLGYVVSSGYKSFLTEMSFRLLVQSERDCDYLESRCDAFLESMEQTLVDMSDEEFERYKSSEIDSRLEKLKNLNEETNRFLIHIGSERYNFDLVHQDVAAIKEVTKQEVLDLYKTFIHPASKTRSKLAVHLVARASSEPQDNKGKTTATDETAPSATKPSTAVVIDDIKAWKDSLPLSTASRPVKDLSEYEESEPKL